MNVGKKYADKHTYTIPQTRNNSFLSNSVMLRVLFYQHK